MVVDIFAVCATDGLVTFWCRLTLLKEGSLHFFLVQIDYVKRRIFKVFFGMQVVVTDDLDTYFLLVVLGRTFRLFCKLLKYVLDTTFGAAC